MPDCPICATPAHERFGGTPYWTCPNCDAWFQSPLPPKVYEAAHEKDAAGGFAGHLMSAHDQSVNRALAQHLFATALRGTPAYGHRPTEIQAYVVSAPGRGSGPG